MIEQMDLEEAIRQRELGMERALDRQTPYREQVTLAINALAASGREFSSDDVREICGDPPAGISTNLTGALFNAAHKAGTIRWTGYAISKRVKGHGNLVRIWVGA